jgi:hypothetical protein
MDERITLKRVVLGTQHLRPGRTKHRIMDTQGMRDFPPFVSLEIVHYPDENSYYLFHISETGEIADTCHDSVAEAMHQAEFEFGVQALEWVDVSSVG